MILKMKEKDLQSFSIELKESKSQKHVILFDLLCDAELSEEEVFRRMDLKKGAY